MTKKRIKYSSNEHTLLYSETGGACPLCGNAIMFKKATSKSPTIGYEIAHIYPLNPNTLQSVALKNFEAPEDVNALDNLILLCPNCHTKYDKDFKIEEYQRLLEIKKGYQNVTEARRVASQYVIQEEVNEILDIITSGEGLGADISATNMDVVALDRKLKSGISPLQKFAIRNDAINFYVPIREKIKLIEQRDQVAVRILQNQINTYYLVISKSHSGNKDFIFGSIADWISQRTGKSVLASRVLTSFFVQNCEVFDAGAD